MVDYVVTRGIKVDSDKKKMCKERTIGDIVTR